jgi:ComF family protein
MGFDATLALGPYDGVLRNLCLHIKRESNAWLARSLIDLLIRAKGDVLSTLVGNSWVVPVPLHWSRLWQRGYNQADALACALAQRLGLPVHRVLQRVVATQRLAPMGLSERQEVMRNAFRARDDQQLVGRTVLLVDDILTTGTTCGAAARTLRRAGAARVVAVVIGRAARGST